MIRSHESMAWYCCGVTWPKGHRYCGHCGMAVMTANRMLLRFPLRNGGSIAVVASGQPDADTWESLAKSVALTASAFEKQDAEKAAEPAAITPETEPSA